jgi:hypothetical protein
LKGIDHLEDLGIDERQILELILLEGWEGVSWIHVAEEPSYSIKFLK